VPTWTLVLQNIVKYLANYDTNYFIKNKANVEYTSSVAPTQAEKGVSRVAREIAGSTEKVMQPLL
jgi:hypothetical protein